MSGWYKIGKQNLLARTIPASAEFCAVGVNDTYVFSEDHQSFADDVSQDVLLEEGVLQGVTYFDGVLDADDYRWESAGSDIDEGVSLNLAGVVIYLKDGSDIHLVAYIDSATVGLPQTLTGTDVTAKWNQLGIFKL